MLYRTMPKNNDTLSVLGFGCMRLPTVDGAIDEERAIAQIRTAVDSGVNYLDTAWPYHGGESEPLLGKALKDGYRDKVKVATKLPPWRVKKREDMDKILDAQLKKLGTGHVDYYLVHALAGFSWDTIKAQGVCDFLEQAKKDGRIVNAGFSFHGFVDDFKRIVDAYDWVFCQIQYNFMDQEFQAGSEGLKYAASKDLGVVIMEPLRGGNLALPSPPPEVAAIWDEAETKRSPVEWALRWVWNHPEVTVLLSGMNDESHIKQNLAIADEAQANSLTADELSLVDRATAKYQELMQVGCTGCAYCMPCPMNVQIPRCFDFYNRMHMFGNEDVMKSLYANFVGNLTTNDAPGFAEQCVACGECMEKCPQGIQIPDVLKKVAEEMEGPGLQERIEMVKAHLSAGA